MTQYVNIRLGLGLTCLYLEHDGSEVPELLLPPGRSVELIGVKDTTFSLRLGQGQVKVNACDPDMNAGNSRMLIFQRGRGHGVNRFSLPLFMIEAMSVRVDGDLLHFTLPPAHELPWGKKPPRPDAELRDIAIDCLAMRYDSALAHGAGMLDQLDLMPSWVKAVLSMGEINDLLRGRHVMQQRGAAA